MGYQHGQKCKAYIGSGGDTPLTGNIYGITNAGGVITITRSAGDFTADDFVIGSLVHVDGFAEEDNNFHAIVQAIAATSVVVVSPVDDDGNPVTPVTEAAGANVTITPEEFLLIKGQRDTRRAGAGNAIDVSNKDTGGFGASIAGTRSMQVTINGIVNWPDETGYARLVDQWMNGAEPWCAMVMNAEGDRWFGRFAITQSDDGGSLDAIEYSFTLANFNRPNLAKIA